MAGLRGNISLFQGKNENESQSLAEHQHRRGEWYHRKFRAGKLSLELCVSRILGCNTKISFSTLII